MPASRRCPTTGCPQLLTPGQRYCATHTQAYEAARGTSTTRGYSTPHRAARAQWAARIHAGHVVTCTRCHQPITTAQAWDLDHDDEDRRNYRGPSHASCNRSAGGSRGNQARRTRLDS